MLATRSVDGLCDMCRDQRSFGALLKQHRERRRMKAYVLAQLCDLADHGTLSKWESGEQLPKDAKIVGRLVENLSLYGDAAEFLFSAWICEKLCGTDGKNCCSD